MNQTFLSNQSTDKEDKKDWKDKERNLELNDITLGNDEEEENNEDTLYREESNGHKTSFQKFHLVNDEDLASPEPIGKKEMETFLLYLNSYWLSIIGNVGLIISILIYECLGIAFFQILIEN